MNPETSLRKRICAMIRQEFPLAWYYHSAFPLRAGVPDLLICYKGFFIGMEIKIPTGKISKIQEYMLNEIRRCGGIGCVVRSVNEAKIVLTNINKVVI